jgi:hypothetical protein
MATPQNSIGFPNLTVKSTPVGADLILLADSASSNTVVQATVTSVQAVGGGITAAKAYGISLLFGR